ncbi:MAG: aspartate kinase [Verrucomicrobiota bacterium]|nr:aspartate kinase [Verrucomicrobiota bacterium]
MALIVQKYGGTSVGNPERIRNVAARVKKWHDEGNKIVVVVSAMSGVTDSLIKLAREVSGQPSEREMDVLLATGEQTTIALTAMALHSAGVKATSMTGAQAGIVTDGFHSKAKIQNITPKKVHAHLDAGEVVIVAGFQGQNNDGHITTLGRGGSDLTAIALAAALKADLCQIYTDVDGVYTCDPRIVKGAQKIHEISYDEMLEMASLGSKVMQSRSVEFAKKFGVIFEVRTSMGDQEGTIVKEETKNMEDVVIRGVSVDKNQIKVSVENLPDVPGIAAKLFRQLSDANINVDMIVQNNSRISDKSTDLTFTVSKEDEARATKAIEAFVLEHKVDSAEVRLGQKHEAAKVSVVGVGMRSHSGVAATMFEALAQEKINIQLISTSEIKISVIIDLKDADRAANIIHDKFGLTKK